MDRSNVLTRYYVTTIMVGNYREVKTIVAFLVMNVVRHKDIKQTRNL